MPRAIVTVGVVRNPTKLAKVINDLQRQISSNRSSLNDVKLKIDPKARAKAKAEAKAVKAKEAAEAKEKAKAEAEEKAKAKPQINPKLSK